MSIKSRFAFIFSGFVAIMLAVSSISIFVLYSNFRESEFYSRVKSEGVIFHDYVFQIKDPKQAAMAKILSSVSTNSVYDEKLTVLDSSGTVINKLPETLNLHFDKALLNEIRNKREIRFEIEKYQSVGMYNPQSKLYTIASGYDISGYRKLKNLEIILVLVFLIGMIMTAFFSFFFVRQAFRPLLVLNKQIKKTTILNLKERLLVPDKFPEINQIADSYNAMLERLGKAFDFQKSFVQHASHELRTPLAIMLSQTESAINKKLSETDVQNLLASLKEDQQGMIDLTNSLLLLSQYELLGYQKEWPNIRVDEAVVEAGSQVMQMFTDAIVNIGFNEIPESDESLFVVGNESLLKSVFINLIKNAYLYASDKRIDVTIGTSNGKVSVQVVNNGPILSEEDASQVMQPFYRGKNALNTNTKGFGLGLSIVTRILFAHHGMVAYDAPSPNSNRFTVVLPQAL
ncbi:MAG: ATP-binding protein [Bacteroidetes bacterium]|nr:ATP-binding protein [Bacteroidota bacterium]